MGMRQALLLLPLLAAGPLCAQEVSGALEGRVVTASGQPVEGAEITVSGTALQGERSGTTVSPGRFTFRSLPAGSYTVAVRRIGYVPVRFNGVLVRLGSTTSLGEVRLEAQAVGMAEIVVVAPRPAIDPVSTATGAVLDSSQFLSLPTQRDFRAIIPFVAEANASDFGDGVNIAGTTGLESAYYVDGMNVTVGGGSSIELPFNFVREIQVLTGGYEAEYGRSLGGIVNVVTPSGGNELHAEAFGFFTNDALEATPKVGLGEPEPSGFSRYDVGLSVGGPIRRDRLWYFVAYNPTFARQEAALPALSDLRGTEVHHLLAGKLTWRAGSRTDVTFTLLGDPSTQNTVTGALDLLPLTEEPGVVLGRRTGGGTTAAAQVRHELGPGTQLDVSLSRLDRRLDIGPRTGSTELVALTRLDDFTTNVSSGAFGFAERSREHRTAARAALTLLRGAHAVKLGAEFENNSYSDDIVTSLISRVDTDVYDWIQQRIEGRVRNRVPTVYAQDAWEAHPRLRVSAGLRWAAEHMSGDAGPSRTIGSELSPRLGVVYQPGELGSQRLFGSAGRFFEQVKPFGQVIWNAEGSTTIREFAQNPLADSAGGVLLSEFDLSAVPVTPGLRGQHFDQFTVGYERRIGRALQVGIRGTHRVLRWAIEDGFAPGDSVYRMGNPGRGPLAAMPRARQRYQALVLTVERSTPGRLYLLASYVLSRNEGNYTGLFATDYLQPAPNSGPQYDVPDLAINADGLLPNDRTHVAKIAASYRIPAGVVVGGLLTVASGTPRSEFGTSVAGAPYVTFVRPRGSAGRTPAIWSLDLHAAWDVPVAAGTRIRPRLVLDVFGVGSPRRAVLYDQLHFLDPEGTQVDPNFGAVRHYQAPMSARAGVAVAF